MPVQGAVPGANDLLRAAVRQQGRVELELVDGVVLQGGVRRGQAVDGAVTVELDQVEKREMLSLRISDK